MLAKYDTTTKDQKVHSVVLSYVHLRSFRESSISSLGISVSQRHGVNGSAN